MNGLQSLTQWSGYFGNPTGGKLGLLNAIQVSASLCLFAKLLLNTPTFPSTLAVWQRIPSRLTFLMALAVARLSSSAHLSCASPLPFRLPLSLSACSSVLGPFLWAPLHFSILFCALQFLDRIRSYLCRQRCPHVGYRDLLPHLPRSAHFDLQLPLVFRSYRVSLHRT